MTELVECQACESTSGGIHICRLECEWCETEARYSINWECGHASAMCETCFGAPDDDDPPDTCRLDILDWGTYGPMNCPNCPI